MAKPELTVEEENAVAAERALAAKRQTRDAFLAVFGPRDDRTPHGQVIIEYLVEFAQLGKLEVVKDLQERTDMYRTGVMHGRQQVLREIDRAIEWREPQRERTE